MGKRVYFETYGCTTNVGDTRTMQGILLAQGHELVEREDDADTVVVNTCTVVDTTDEKIGHRLRTLRAAGKDVVAAGCMAAARPDKVHKEHPEARLLAPRHLHHIDDALAGRAYTPTERHKSRLPRLLMAPDAILQISEGCLFSCSYCLTKTARGDQTSNPLDGLIADARDAINAGALEIKLTSQDTAGYGVDSGHDLPTLVRRITAIGGDFRVRVGMMHPRTALRVLDDLLDAMDHPKVYQFLHLPVQTGSEAMLRRMNRGHRLDEFWHVVEAFRARFPHGTISTDIIVGHPGERHDDHAETLALLRRLDAEHVNITKWSARPGTAAKTMDGRVTTQEAKRRSRELTAWCLARWAERQQKRLGQILEVVITEPGDRDGTAVGRGPGYEPVVVRGAPMGSRCTARVTDARPTYLVAEPVGPIVPAGKVVR